jgi:hypothetical protein
MPLAAGGAGEEGGGGGGLDHGQFLNLKINANLQEVRQRIGAAEVEADGFKPSVEPADDVEDEGAVGDRFTKIAEILCLALVLPAIVNDGKVALTEGPEVGVSVQGARGLIPEKLGLDGEPDVASEGTMLGDGVGEVVGDGAEEPSPNDTVHADPVGGGGDGGVREDMALEGVPPKGEEEGFTPTGLEGGCPVETKKDEQTDVLYQGRLSVEVEKRSGLVLTNGVVDGLVGNSGKGGVVIVVVVDRRRREIGRGAFPRGTVEAKAGGGRIALCLHRGGLAFCISRAGQSSVAGGLARAGVGGRHGPTIRMKVADSRRRRRRQP